MQDIDWDDLRYFLAVAHAGSLSGAATSLHVNHSTVLRRLRGLQQRLGVRLFERVPTGYAMTAAGEALAERLSGVGERIDAAQRQLSGLDLRLSGTIRLTSTDTLMHGLLMPYLAEFRHLHPSIRLELVVNNTFLSLTRREADVAVRPSNKPPEHLIGRRIGHIQTAIYAGGAYFGKKVKKTASPATDEKLDWSVFDWVVPDESLAHLAQAKWVRKHVPAEKVAVQSASLVGMAEAVREGMGLGLLLCLLAEQRREFVRVAGPFEEMNTQVWVLTHPDLASVARIKALTDFLYERLRSSKFLVPNERAGSHHG
jgi:DNA-binding transcriptional LysR family regulator